MKKRSLSQWLGYLALTVVAALVFVGVIVMLKQHHDHNQLGLYLNSISQTQVSMKIGLVNLNKEFAKFDGTPKTAIELQPKFEEAERLLSETAEDLGSITPPPLAVSFHTQLLEFYKDSSAFTEDMIIMSEYIRASAPVMDRFSKASDGFTKSVTAAKTDKDLVAAVVGHRRNAEATLKEVRSIEPSRVFADSHRATLDYLTALSGSLQDLADAITSGDNRHVEDALMETVKVIDGVGKAQKEGIVAGAGKYNEQLQLLDKHRRELEKDYDVLRSSYSNP